MAKKTEKTTNKKTGNLLLTPSAGVVIVEPKKLEKKTSSGIYLPETSSEKKSAEGKVLAVGKPEITKDGKEVKTLAKVGDYVIYKEWGGNEAKIEDKDFLFVKFEDILAVVEYSKK